MEISTEIRIKLSTDEVKKIIIDYLKSSQNIEVEYVNFNVNVFYDDCDWRGEYPDHRLADITCIAKK